MSANQNTSAPNSTQQQNNTELIDLKQSMDSLFNEKTKYQFDTQYGYSININNADSSNRIIGFEGIGLNTTSVPSIQGQKFNPVLAVPYKARFTSNYLVTSLDNSLAFQNYTNFKPCLRCWVQIRKLFFTYQTYICFFGYNLNIFSKSQNL